MRGTGLPQCVGNVGIQSALSNGQYTPSKPCTRVLPEERIARKNDVQRCIIVVIKYERFHGVTPLPVTDTRPSWAMVNLRCPSTGIGGTVRANCMSNKYNGMVLPCVSISTVTGLFLRCIMGNSPICFSGWLGDNGG